MTVISYEGTMTGVSLAAGTTPVACGAPCARGAANPWGLPGTRGMVGAVGHWLVEVDVAVSDLDVEPAFWVRADPSLVVDSSALPSEVGQGDQFALLASVALRKNALQRRPPPVLWRLTLGNAADCSIVGSRVQGMRRDAAVGQRSHAGATSPVQPAACHGRESPVESRGDGAPR